MKSIGRCLFVPTLDSEVRMQVTESAQVVDIEQTEGRGEGFKTWVGSIHLSHRRIGASPGRKQASKLSKAEDQLQRPKKPALPEKALCRNQSEMGVIGRTACAIYFLRSGGRAEAVCDRCVGRKSDIPECHGLARNERHSMVVSIGREPVQ
jgi:hypothetical protein